MRKAVLIVNTGSPSAPTTVDVRRFLREFLSDPKVMDMPWLLRKALLELFILPRRSPKSAEAYGRVWGKEGSPLVALSHRQADGLQSRVDMPVHLAMRYGEPSIRSAAENLRRDGVQKLLLIPMYPQYATSTYESTVVAAVEACSETAPSTKVEIVQPFFEDPGYIDALVAVAKPFLGDGFQRLLFSYHSLPERHIVKCDPSRAHCLQRRECCRLDHPAHATCYRHQCLRTTELFIKRAGVSGDLCAISFQSRFGGGEWLGPSTSDTIRRFGEEGIGTLLVATPGFTADCLETLDEIGNVGRKIFHEASGGELVSVPCLNDNPSFLDFLAAKVKSWAERA